MEDQPDAAQPRHNWVAAAEHAMMVPPGSGSHGLPRAQPASSLLHHPAEALPSAPLAHERPSSGLVITMGEPRGGCGRRLAANKRMLLAAAAAAASLSTVGAVRCRQPARVSDIDERRSQSPLLCPPGLTESSGNTQSTATDVAAYPRRPQQRPIHVAGGLRCCRRLSRARRSNA